MYICYTIFTLLHQDLLHIITHDYTLSYYYRKEQKFMAKIRVNITIDQELHDELKKTGKYFCRSVSQEIEYRLLHPTSTNTITTTATPTRTYYPNAVH